jgi:hypothetical protein
MQQHQENTMATEPKDRRINTDERVKNDGAKRLPHERDESPDAQDAKPRGVMKQAADDLERGLVDTDLHGMRGVEAVAPKQQSGQARPQEDAANGMRERKPSTPPTGKQ